MDGPGSEGAVALLLLRYTIPPKCSKFEPPQGTSSTQQAWSDDEALEWYPGCATPSDPNDVNCDVYDVVFDDGDGRERVKREELRSVFVPGAFDWASPFVEDDDEVEEEEDDSLFVKSFYYRV